MRVLVIAAVLAFASACGGAPSGASDSGLADAGQELDAGDVVAACDGGGECVCAASSDCAIGLTQDVQSSSDCYCPFGCGGEPMNVATSDLRRSHFNQYCAGWESGFPDGGGCGVCNACSCALRSPACVEGRCVLTNP